MSNYAIIDTTQGTVVKLVVHDPGVTGHPNPTRPELEWVDVTAVQPQPQVGWTYNGSVFAAPVSETNRDSLTQKSKAALQSNQTFQALQTPTNAQVVAQVQSLTRQMNALIRLVTDQFDSTSGT